MSLAPGFRLGPYEILAAIGAGGMGEVYRARDTRLDRTVAIKVLPDAFVADQQLRDRFAREARVISSLDHPNICVLYDVGQEANTAFLVMQYLEGETLERRLAKGALPVEQALRYAIEIADALQRAHRQGIVHRDLKPGNIILTRSGAKVLDFGLAKINPAGGGGLGTSGAPTTPPSITAQGVILGTFQYMAPEQLEGSEADARTDIFAFGAVLYEMVTGRRAFDGKSQASLISAIMSATPAPLSTLQPLAPAGLERVVKKCLEKDPDERWQSARDLEDELKWVAGGSVATAAVPAGVAIPPPRRGARLAWSVAAMLGAALIAGAVLWRFERRQSTIPAGAPITFATGFPDGWGPAPPQESGISTAPLAVSPDGRRIAFVALSSDKRTQIWIRALDSLSGLPLPGTDGASSPFWSPDSRYLAFFADGQLKKIDVAGGPAVTLCAAPQNVGGTWGADGVIVFAPSANSVLQKVAASGGIPTPATRFATGETMHWRPSFLPDGRHFIYRTNAAGERGPFRIAAIDSTDSTLLLQADSSNAIYSDGHLLFMLGSTLMAQPFDVNRRAITGEPFPVADQVQQQAVISVPNGIFSASPTGVLAYRTGETEIGNELIWFDRKGVQLARLGERARYTDLELSPDGARLAVGVIDPTVRRADLWIFEIERNVRTRFTSDPASEGGARWTADGKNIAYYVNGKGIFLKPSGSSAPERRLIEASHNEYPDSWTPDQRSLLYEMNDEKTSWDLWVLPLAPGSKPHPFIQAPMRQEYGRISPDGRWVAYRSTESNRDEIYVVPYPGPGDKVQISTNGGIYPRWRRDGKELFYLSMNRQLTAVGIDGNGSALKVGAATPLFDIVPYRSDWPYDVSADGKRFIVNSRVEESNATPFTVVVNWTAGIRK